MSTASRNRRNSSYMPEFDPYGYSPYDPKHAEAKSQGARTSRRRSAALDDLSGWDQPSTRRSSSAARRYTPKAKDDYPREKDDGWDTDYDPRDKYYLSGNDEDEFDYRSPSGRSPTRKGSKSRSQDRDRGSHSERPRKSSRDQGSTHGSHSHSRPPLAQRDSNERTTQRRPSARPKAMSRYSSSSSVNTRPSRPRAVSRYSSYTKPRRASKYPPNSSRTQKGSAQTKAGGGGASWGTAARSALQAGAIAALKVQSQPGSWIGDKGTKVATAAAGAALVDTLMARKAPKKKGGIRHAAFRQVTELAIGNMVMGPAMNKGARVAHRR